MNEDNSGSGGRVLARVVAEEALKKIVGGYFTNASTECGCDITNAAGDDDGWVEGTEPGGYSGYPEV